MLREFWAETKFYARDVLRGPYAKTLVGGITSGVLTGCLAFVVFVLLVDGVLEVVSRR